MKPNPATIETVAGDAAIDRAIATLVLAFSSDPIARWMYDDPHQYLLQIPRLFRALGASSFEGGHAQCFSAGFGVALWLPPDVHGDDASVEAIIAHSIAEDKRADVMTLFEQTELFRPKEPHWYLSLIGVEAMHRNKGYGGALLQNALRQCDREHRPSCLWSSNPMNIPLYERHGFVRVGTIQAGSSPSIAPMLRRAR